LSVDFSLRNSRRLGGKSNKTGRHRLNISISISTEPTLSFCLALLNLEALFQVALSPFYIQAFSRPSLELGG
jgi:hypothetical protein